MSYFQKYKFEISVLVAIALAGTFCLYTIFNYKGSTQTTRMGMGQHNFNGPKDNQGQGPNMKSSNSNQNDNVAPPQNDGNQDGKTATSQNGGSEGAPTAPSQNQHNQSQDQGMRQGNKPNIGGITSTSSSYSNYLIVYGIVFLGAIFLIYRLHKYKKVKISANNEKVLLVGLLTIGLLLRISYGLLYEGHPYDLSTFKNWATSVASNFSGFYSGAKSSDYPPLYIYVLFLIGKLANLAAMSKYFTLLIKLPPIVADIATSYIIYKIAKKYLSAEISILISALYIFNPAIFINSVFWGQVDSFFTFIIVCSVYLMSEGKLALASVLFTCGVLMKPQGIVYLPIVLFELVRQKNIKSFLKVIFAGLVTTAIVILPFSLSNGVLWIFKLFSNTLGEYPYASVNGYNFYSLLGKNYVNDSSTFFIFSYHIYGLIFIVCITLFSWFIYFKGNSRKYAFLAALIQISGVFTFSTRMHERYLFPAVALAIMAYVYIRDKRLLLLAVGFSISVYMNTHAVLFQTSSGINTSPYGTVLFINSLLNVILFGYLAKVAWDVAVKKK